MDAMSSIVSELCTVSFREACTLYGVEGQNATEYVIFWSDLTPAVCAGFTRMKSLSHLTCLPEVMGLPPGKVSGRMCTRVMSSTFISSQLGSGRELDPSTCHGPPGRPVRDSARG